MGSYLAADAALIRSLAGAEQEPQTDALFLLYAVLMRVKGSAVTGEDVHDAWAAWMQQRDPDHPALVPYGELDEPTRNADEPFAAAIREAAKRTA